MNLAIIVWYLTKYPDKYEALKKELREANPTEDEVQNLPYLKAVVQEGTQNQLGKPNKIPPVSLHRAASRSKEHSFQQVSKCLAHHSSFTTTQKSSTIHVISAQRGGSMQAKK